MRHTSRNTEKKNFDMRKNSSPHPQFMVCCSYDTTQVPWAGERVGTASLGTVTFHREARLGTVTFHGIRPAADLEVELHHGVIKSMREQEGLSVCQQSRRERWHPQSFSNPVPHRHLLLRCRYCYPAGMGSLCMPLCEFSTPCFSH